MNVNVKERNGVDMALNLTWMSVIVFARRNNVLMDGTLMKTNVLVLVIRNAHQTSG